MSEPMRFEISEESQAAMMAGAAKVGEAGRALAEQLAAAGQVSLAKFAAAVAPLLNARQP